MITLKDYLEAVNYKITGGSEYGWQCFGPNARYLDCQDREDSDGDFSGHAIFDSEDQTVYSIEVWDYVNDREYRWIHPDFVSEFKQECSDRELDPRESLDGKNYIDIDVPEDILDKLQKIVAKEEYDDRVQVPVNFTDAELLQYMKLAHELDITFNELVERAIKEAIKDYERDPDSFKNKAERFINENNTSV
jgi:hypothetical protein